MTKKTILFLCTGNSCRSQMAEGWGRHLKGDKYNFLSAGIETHGLNPNAVKVMAEAGVDITNQTSDNIAQYEKTPIDYVITVCGHAHETCPVFPTSAKIVHVPFDDPPRLAEGKTGEEAFEPYRRVRDEIKDFISSIENHIN